jgi:hypothetical protein
VIKIDDHTDVDLDQLAQNFYEFLNPKDNGRYATQSLVRRIERQKLADAADPQRVLFWDYLLNNSYANLKRIIVSRPHRFRSILNEIAALIPLNFFSNSVDYETASVTPFGQIVKDVFNYKSLYRNKSQCETNCQALKLIYCPYCNETPVPVITSIDGLTGIQEQMALSQLDHFLPQSRHPYFALSFFNLIPGCASCNSQLKGEKDFSVQTHFNPFHNRLDDYYKFELNTFTPNNSTDLVIFYVNKAVYPPNALVDFRIIDRYNENQKEVIYNLVISLKNHSSKIRRSISQQFRELFVDGNAAKSALILANGIPVDRNQISNLPVGKLKRDIAIDFGVL